MCREENSVELPEDFKERMKRQLGNAYGDFLASYENERTYGLRYNPLKIEKDRLAGLLAQQTALEPVEWAKEGFYYPADTQPGRLPLHEAGAYYIQEPSAMSVVELLELKPGDTVLDLCAAPGGKSTQAAGRLRGEGILLSNEIIASRAKILSRNIERMGVVNAVVLNETPQHLAERFPVFFDKILVDAPCSGEGMFRKDENARGEWSLAQVEACAERQRGILAYAAEMLKPGGILAYSTCTFAPQENEETAEWFVQEYPQFTLEQSVRILPHLQRGEGHYAAKFRKAGTLVKEKSIENLGGRKADGSGAFAGRKNAHKRKKERESGGMQEAAALLQEFLQQTLTERTLDWFQQCIARGQLALFGDYLYLVPYGIGSLDGLKVERAGLQLGICRKNRFEPSHALAMALCPNQVKQVLELEEPERYLRGEAVSCGGQKGWTLAAVCGCSIGWGKAAQGVLKNHYPKGLRRDLRDKTPGCAKGGCSLCRY